MLTWPFSTRRRRQHQRFKRRERTEDLIDQIVEDETERLHERERELMTKLSESQSQVYRLTQERDALQRMIAEAAARQARAQGEGEQE